MGLLQKALGVAEKDNSESRQHFTMGLPEILDLLH